MPILNYTTTIDPSKTVGEIHGILVKHGAREIISKYDEESELSEITFKILLNNDSPLYFNLPCNWQGVLMAMRSQKVKASYLTPKQARRTAWRIIKDWIEAQMAFVEAGQAKVQQVLLPYAVMDTGRTFYEEVITNPKRLLGEG